MKKKLLKKFHRIEKGCNFAPTNREVQRVKRCFRSSVGRAPDS